MRLSPYLVKTHAIENQNIEYRYIDGIDRLRWIVDFLLLFFFRARVKKSSAYTL